MNDSKDRLFIEEHIFSRNDFDDYLKEDTHQKRANKAFYAVWTNYIFINPVTENLRELQPEQYSIIKKLTYSAKNRLQSYIAFHLNKDHYGMRFEDFTEMESISTIEMCREIFYDTKILVDWWRKPVNQDTSQTGEQWFQECKEKYQRRKQINRLGYLFINLKTKQFLIYDGEQVAWTRNQNDATLFNTMTNELIDDQSLTESKIKIAQNIKKITKNAVKMEDLKMFNSIIERNSQTYNFE